MRDSRNLWDIDWLQWGQQAELYCKRNLMDRVSNLISLASFSIIQKDIIWR